MQRQEYSYETDEDNWASVSCIAHAMKKRSDCTGITTNSSDIGESDSQYECTDRDYTDEYDIKSATLTPLCLSRKEAGDFFSLTFFFLFHATNIHCFYSVRYCNNLF